MRVVVQRVTEASVSIDGNIKSSIDEGLLILLGVCAEDTTADIEWLCKKISSLRIFSDDEGKMNRSLIDLNGEVLVISQFTLFASTKKGNRPSYIRSAKPEIAIPLYEEFVKSMSQKVNSEIKTGVFGADMKVSLVNNGPVTISLDSKAKE